MINSSECGGHGFRKQMVTQNISIPKGVNTGTRLRIPRMGGNNGDLFINIEVEPHPYFKREGADIHTTRLITIAQAALGGTIEVPTIHGTCSLKLRPGTQPGKVLTDRKSVV